MPIHRSYGWIPDLPDQRDHLFAAAPAILAKLPPKMDLRSGLPGVYDQGQLGSCTANAIAGAIQFSQKQQKLQVSTPSRLFVYYNERDMEGTANSDAGAMIRDGVKSVSKQGYCPETEWPYQIQKFADKPPAKCYKDALKSLVLGYQRLLSTNLNQLKGCIAAGFPFVFGFTVYDSFESQDVAKTGELPMPGPSERSKAATPFWPSATTTQRSDSPCEIRGARIGASKATAPCRTLT